LCENYAEKNGYNIVSEFSEIVPGNSRLDERAAMLDCITYCVKNKIKTIVISEVDRFSRNVDTAKDILSMVKPLGIRFIILDYNLDTSKSQKQIDKLLNVVEMSHYELKKIKYRLDTGRDKYLADGGKLGRKKGTIKTKEQKKEEYSEVLKLLFDGDGYSIRKIAALTGVSVATIVRLKSEFKEDYNEVVFAESRLS
jgi:DNA invertase Pin-like site-specific DNA recombinase